MLDRPPLLALEYFVATAKHGTVRAAANQLFVTPSAVSHQVKRLEEFLQIQLFHRHKRRLILTEAGAHYLNQLENSFTQIRQATLDIARQDKHQHLRVSVPPTFLVSWLLPRVKGFLDDHRELAFTFVDSLTIDPLRKDIDCGIEYRANVDERFICEKLFDDEVVPVASPNYVEKHDITELKDMRRCTLIETEKRAYSWANVLREFPWRNRCRVLTMQYTYQALTSVSFDLGIALANRHNAADMIGRGTLVVPFQLDMAHYHAPSYYFSYSPKKEGKQAVRDFRQWLLTNLDSGGPPEKR